MKKTAFFSLILVGALAGCASGSKGSNADVDAQLKVTGANSQLKAKLQVKNLTDKEVVIKDLNSKYFVVQTADGKPVETKGSADKPAPPLKIKPGETAEAVFSLQNNYSFWDRLTKYKITYEGPDLKTGPVQVWF